MTRDLNRLTSREFDLLIIGAGIYGVAAAWDAALRGLEVAIIDRGDFGGGTSFNSAKTVHGGVRSLQRGAIREMREYMTERRTLCRIAPHLVHPLPFLMPTTFSLKQNRWLLRAYFALNDALSRDRNESLDTSKHLPASRLISRDECLHLNPLIDPTRVTGGIVWHDCQIYNTDRLALSFVSSAVERGATAANYVDCTGWLRDTRVVGITATDVLSHETFDVRAKVVLNAAGPWAHKVVEPLFAGRHNPLVSTLSKAMNLVTKRLTGVHAVAGMAGSRLLFAAPWREFSIVGTSHDPHRGGPDELSVRRNTVSRFLRDVHAAFPGARLKLGDIRLVHRGFLPAVTSTPRRVALLRKSQIRDHRQDGRDGVVSVVGTRYTTARRTAEQAVDLVFDVLGQTPPPCETATTPLTGGDIESFPAFLEHTVLQHPNGISPSARRRLGLSYGTGYEAVFDVMHEEPGSSTPLSDECDVTRAEILYACREEMAMKLSDAVLRRTEAGSAGHPGSAALEEAARLMARELGWDATRMQREIDDVERVYRIYDE
ncbi:MAG: glycerol-3-phosphate dehydrogenase/oxidase [Acidobacteria bacterium]|nr:glycerol-3-phosphate dehydrogenase/oxidase [Acidobacteriota bacterium]